MIVLGMDLSIACPGFAVGRIENGQVEVLHLSHVKTSPQKSHGERLRIIADHIHLILNEQTVQAVAREKAIPAGGRGFGMTAQIQTVMVLNKVVGISDLVTNDHGFKEIFEIAPTSLKKKLTGSGSADKKEVQNAVRPFLVEDVKFKNTDESDAMAVVIAYGIEKGLLVV